MNAIIGRYYKNYGDARKWADSQEKVWKKRIKFWVISYSEGNLVVSGSVARKTFPDLFPKRKIGNRNEYKTIR